MFAWVNDEHTLRAYESSADAYWVFRNMLENGHPTDGWSSLLAQARVEGIELQQLVGAIAP